MQFPTSCRRLANDSELVYAGTVLYGGCVKKHEGVNAFNLVFLTLHTISFNFFTITVKLTTSLTPYVECYAVEG